MGAGTEGFRDTRGNVNPIGSIISKMLQARKMAEEEREYASQIAEENQTSLEEAGIERGYFFKQALKYKFGGEFVDKKKNQLKNFLEKKNTAKAIMLGKSGNRKYDKSERIDMIWSLFKKGPKAPTFRDKFKELYKVSLDDPSVEPKSSMLSGSVKKIQKATGRKRVSKEELFEVLTKLLTSLEATAKSLNSNVAASSAGIIKAADAQDSIADQLKYRANTLEEKLDNLIKVISEQTKTRKSQQQIKKISAAEKKLEDTKDSSSTETFDDVTTQGNEPIEERVEKLEQLIDKQQNYPQAETGAIFSGPDSGYPVELHGNEAVIPLDNAFTDPKKPAVTEAGKRAESAGVSNMEGITPMMPKQSYEIGTTAPPPSMGGKLGFNLTNKLAVGGTTQASAMSQSLMDAMSLPMVATGGRILATTTEYMKSVGDTGLGADISRIARPIANVFGLPSSIVQKATAGKSTETSAEEDGEDGMGSKNILAKLTEGFGKLLESMGKKIEENQPDPTGGLPQPADISGNEKELLKRLMIAEAGGEGIEGMAMVGRSVLNRAGLVQSGKLGAGQFNAESGSVTDIIQAPLQYQPYREGKLNRPLNAEENARAEAAYQLMMNDPEFRTAIKTKFNLSESDVKKAAAATGFRNASIAPEDASQQVNEFIAGRHTFNTAGNPGLLSPYSSATVAQPSPPPNPPPAQKDLGQEITQNFGMQVGEERTFQHPKYGEIKAHKTAKGFKFFGPGINNVLNMQSNTAQAKSIVDYFINSNGGRTRVDETSQAMAPPTQPRSPTAAASTDESSSNQSPMIAALNLGGSPSTTGTSPQSTAEVLPRPGTNPVQDIYHNVQKVYAETIG